MRQLTQSEIVWVSGSAITFGDNSISDYDIFMSSFYASAGAVSGTICGIPIGIGIAIYSIGYYGVYTPLYYVASVGSAALGAIGNGLYNGTAAIGNGLYNGGAYVAHASGLA